jgi:DNA invertase Pin-like site-specific DNA recombinase
MPYCLYVRKSRADAEAEARGEGETLSRHINTLLELAKRRHLDITQIYREIVSGETIAARPVMQQLLSEVEQGLWDGVLVMEVERLARGDTVDQGIVAQTFKFSDTLIITPIKDYNPNNEFDEEYFEFGLFMSRREYKTINRRLQRGRLASVKEGKYVGSQSPYGYERVKIKGDKGYTLEPFPPEADVVRMIFDWYTRGEELPDGSFRRLGVSLIVRRLNSLKIPPRKSDHWATATVRDILINPVYVGKVRWNWRSDVKKMVDGRVVIERPRNSLDKCTVAEGLHPPLVSVEAFAIAQELMSSNPPRPVGERGTVKNPLAGIIVCAKCGHRMTRRPYTGRDYPDTLMCADTACDNISCALHYVERRVLEALQEWLADYKLQWETGGEENPAVAMVAMKEKALRRLDTEYTTLTKQLDNTHDLLEQGVYTTEQFLERSRKLSERIKKNEEDRLALGADIASDKSREAGRKQIIPKVERLLEVYYELPTPKAKNDMLKEVLEKVVYLKTKNGRWNNAPDDFELTLYPKIPMSGE